MTAVDKSLDFILWCFDCDGEATEDDTHSNTQMENIYIRLRCASLFSFMWIFFFMYAQSKTHPSFFNLQVNTQPKCASTFSKKKAILLSVILNRWL